MSEVLNNPRQAAGMDTVSERRRRGLDWRRLQMIAAAVTIASFIVPMVIEGRLEGFLAAMAAPFVIGLVLVRFLPRVGAIFLGVVAVAILTFSAPFLGDALSHPESAVDFVPLTFLTLATLIVAVAAIPAYREVRGTADASRTARRVAVAAAIVGVAASVLSFVSSARVESATAQPGDVAVLARDFAFAPGQMRAEAGAVSVSLTNEDSTRHTFTIDGLVDLNVPPNTTQRATFDAAPGTYRFYCIPHDPDMDGVLVVE